MPSKSVVAGSSPAGRTNSTQVLMAFVIGLVLLVTPIVASGRGVGSRRAYLIAAAVSIAGATLHAVSYPVDRPANDLADSVFLSLGGVLLMLGVGLVVAGIIALKTCPFCAARTRRPALVCPHCGRGFLISGGGD
jgi:hypothetical protein